MFVVTANEIPQYEIIDNMRQYNSTKKDCLVLLSHVHSQHFLGQLPLCPHLFPCKSALTST